MIKKIIIFLLLIVMVILAFLFIDSGLTGMVVMDSGIEGTQNVRYYLQIGVGILIVIVVALLSLNVFFMNNH